MKAAFKELNAELRASSGRDFERRVYAWMKVIFPELVLPSALKDLDKKGVDMAFVVPDGVFPVVIQCKEFEVAFTQLSDSHVGQVRGAVKSFLKSKLQCRRYIVLYNRDGDNREFSLSEVFIQDVPVHRQHWSLDAGARKTTLKSQTAIRGTRLPKLLLEGREGRFPLVIGAYGMGMSTMMRHFPLPDGYKRLLIPAGVLKHIEHSGGE